MIKLVNVDRVFNNNRVKIHAVNNVSITFPEKGLVILCGKSGSGKSTLLNIIGGLESYSGEVVYKNQVFKSYNDKKMDKIRKEDFGYIFQNFNLLETRTVFDNINISLKMINDKENKNEEIIEILKSLNISKIKNKNINELSTGQKQRVAIARALIKNPDVIIADEPTGNLDSENSEEVLKIIKKISKEKLVILVTHNEKLALKYADRIIEIQDGKIIKDSELTSLTYSDKVIKNESKDYKNMFSIKNSLKTGLNNLKISSFKQVIKYVLLFVVGILLSLSFNRIFTTSYIDKGNIKIDKNVYETKIIKDKYERFNELLNNEDIIVYRSMDSIMFGINNDRKLQFPITIIPLEVLNLEDENIDDIYIDVSVLKTRRYDHIMESFGIKSKNDLIGKHVSLIDAANNSSSATKLFEGEITGTVDKGFEAIYISKKILNDALNYLKNNSKIGKYSDYNFEIIEGELSEISEKNIVPVLMNYDNYSKNPNAIEPLYDIGSTIVDTERPQLKYFVTGFYKTNENLEFNRMIVTDESFDNINFYYVKQEYLNATNNVYNLNSNNQKYLDEYENDFINLYDAKVNEHINNKNNFLAKEIMIYLGLIIIALVIAYFVIKSFILNEVKKFGIYRVLGASKREIKRMISVEYLSLVSLTSVIAAFITNFIIYKVTGEIVLGFVRFNIAVIFIILGLILIYVLSYIILIFIINKFLNRTPVSILKKYDI